MFRERLQDMLTVPNQLGPEYNLHVLESFAKHVAPALGWQPNTEGPVQGDPVVPHGRAAAGDPRSGRLDPSRARGAADVA